jgi:N-acetylmuramic acid 6-phosphate (MurNAc-6-P) etherase
MIVTGVSYDEAVRVLDLAGGSVKTAIVMIKAGVAKEEAESMLAGADGFVGRALVGGQNSS